jgi:hypothetical protein
MELAVHFGPAWTGAEMVPLWAKHVASASAERRTLVAEALQQLSGAVDQAAQGHALLGSVQRLCEDRLEQVGGGGRVHSAAAAQVLRGRMTSSRLPVHTAADPPETRSRPQVREAAVASLSHLLPQLHFSRPYYGLLEETLLALAQDHVPAIHAATCQQLLPAFLGWARGSDLVVSSPGLCACLAELPSSSAGRHGLPGNADRGTRHHEYSGCWHNPCGPLSQPRRRRRCCQS